ncbi:trypsin-like serine protease [Paenibacillus aestuarii]|uniref:Trypsin-like serine protease n=1 Tax=Paenibacillus aestuarii TaxID=516965 RepID=A0ABW0K239_9BACL|nr:trypsin-like serine protease [Paenibacillus aestuarii]
MTAGHCLGAIGETWYQGGRSIGTTAAKSSSSYADAGLILVSPDKLSHYIYSNNNSTYMTMKSTLPLGGETVGDTVCVSGGKTDNSNCGTVISTNFSGSVAGGGYYSGQVEANYYAQSGDSGGPTFSAYQLMGIHVATNLSNNYDNLYSKVSRVLSSLGVTAITGY